MNFMSSWISLTWYSGIKTAFYVKYIKSKFMYIFLLCRYFDLFKWSVKMHSIKVKG